MVSLKLSKVGQQEFLKTPNSLLELKLERMRHINRWADEDTVGRKHKFVKHNKHNRNLVLIISSNQTIEEWVKKNKK